jgi:hypothetical protein
VAAATSWAQVYSVNAVGYVNLTVPGNGADLAIIANPLNGTNNSINTILPLPLSAVDTVIYLFDVDGSLGGIPQNYFATQYYDQGTGSGIWFPEVELKPGVAFFIAGKDTSGTLAITFVGEVPQGLLVNQLQASPLLSMASSMVPQAGKLDALSFPGSIDDVVYLWDVNGTLEGTAGRQQYVAQQRYDDGAGGQLWFPDNTINVAQGFFVKKSGSSNLQWTRDFNVSNP